jgi:signal transduction histidine kinase
MRRLRLLLIALAVLAVAEAVGMVYLTIHSHHERHKVLEIVTGVLVGSSFVATGIYAWWRRPENRVGALMTAVGLTFFLGGVVEANDRYALVAGILLVNVFFAVAVQMLLAYPQGKLPGWRERGVVAAAYLATTVFIVPCLLFKPFGTGEEQFNPIMVHRDKALANFFLAADQVLGVILVAVVIWLLVARWRRATAPERRVMAPVVWAGAGTMALLAVDLGTELLSMPNGVVTALDIAGAAAFVSVPFAFLLGIVHQHFARAASVGQLIAALNRAPEPGRLRDALADALGDRSLALAYWLPDRERYVDATGRAVELPEPGRGRAYTEIERDGRRVAAIVHDATLADDTALVGAAGAAAAMALENERLEAELRAKIDEVRASRTRLLEVGMAERRRLERDLHDGAQQRLVALSLTLGLALQRIEEDPSGSKALVEEAHAEAVSALAELRELARGIHPAVLSDRGLGPALRSLADRAPIPVEIAELPRERLPPAVEAASYFVVAEALANMAKHAGATRAIVEVERVNGHARIVVRDDGQGGADPERGSGLRGLAYRVSALDGRLAVDSPSGEGTTVTAEIPCVS